MKLQELIREARIKNKPFNKLIRKRMLMKNHPPLAWLMLKLEAILGRDYVVNAAKEEIKRQD